MRQRQFKWARGCPYIEWRGSHSRWKSTVEKSWPSEEPTGEIWRRQFNRSLCVQIVAVGGSDIVSTHRSIQTSFLEHNTSNAPMVDSEASVQPVLKANHSHPNMLSGTKYVHCIGAYLFDHRFNRCYRVCWLDFCLHPEKIDRHGIGPSAKHRMHQCMGHRLNRCYCFSWFLANLTWSLNVTLIVSSSKCFVDFF